MTSNDKWYSLRIGRDPLFSPLSTFLVDVDTKHRLLIIVYFLLMFGAYFYVQTYLVYMDGPFLCQVFSTMGSSFIGVDILFVGVAILVYIGTDFWKMGFSLYTLIIIFVLSLSVAISVMVPFYLAMRVSRACKIKANKYRNESENINIESEYQNVGNKRQNSWTTFIPITLLVCLIIWFFMGPTPFPKPSLCNPE